MHIQHCVHMLWIMLQWTWEYRCVFESLFPFPLDIYPEVELPDMLELFLIFWGTSILYSTVAKLFYISINRVGGSPFLYILTDTHPHLLSSGWQLCDRCEVIPHHDFHLHFPDDYQCWTPFPKYVGHLYVSFGKNVWSGPLLPFFYSNSLAFCFVFLFSCITYFAYWPLIRYMICKYFLRLYGLPFHFVDGFLCCAEAVSLMEFHLFILTFPVFASGIISKRPSPRPPSRSLCPLLF